MTDFTVISDNDMPAVQLGLCKQIQALEKVIDVHNTDMINQCRVNRSMPGQCKNEPNLMCQMCPRRHLIDLPGGE